MTAAEQLSRELHSLAGFASGEVRTITTDAGSGATFRVDVALVEQVACSIRRLTQTVTLAADAETDLSAWGARIASEVSYLLEDLTPLEHDAVSGAVQLRSEEPDQNPERRRYYEVLLSHSDAKCELLLRRFEKRPENAAREPINMTLTQEMLLKLLADLEEVAPSA